MYKKGPELDIGNWYRERWTTWQWEDCAALVSDLGELGEEKVKKIPDHESTFKSVEEFQIICWEAWQCNFLPPTHQTTGRVWLLQEATCVRAALGGWRGGVRSTFGPVRTARRNRVTSAFRAGSAWGPRCSPGNLQMSWSRIQNGGFWSILYRSNR